MYIYVYCIEQTMMPMTMLAVMMMMMMRHSLFLMQKQTPRDARNKQRTEMAIDRDALHHHRHCRRHYYHHCQEVITINIVLKKEKAQGAK